MDSVWTRLRLGFAAFFTILFQGRVPTELQPLASPPPVQVLSENHDRAVQMLALFQRDGRLVDFLMEDLGTYSDAQVGAAVRDVHAGSRKVLERYLTLEPVLPGTEGGPIDITSAIDPASIRLVGNLAGRPPLRGTLLHCGWRAARIELPPLGSGAARTVVAQAEIEVG